ncbi:hypothetical protein DEO72_LG2g1754 [Vigna unguiculata]|uniref:Uncharacterized protein n=1 Tax=Vigna unguiculata TaxID=3917 RepID=A0A4D6KUN6_VIGUN|nr:hypothetical protein DEO72_LG2g1754 [Vigna unguiculata]
MVDALVSRVAEVRRWCRDDGGAAEKMIASGTAGWFVVAAGVQWWREAAQVHGCRCAKRGGVRDGAVAGSRRCRCSHGCCVRKKMVARFVVQWRRDDVLAVVVGNGGANGGPARLAAAAAV